MQTYMITTTELFGKSHTSTKSVRASVSSRRKNLHRTDAACDALCEGFEAATPDEIKAGGAGWTMTAGFAPSPFGDCLAAHGPRGVCHLSFVDSGRKTAWEELKRL